MLRQARSKRGGRVSAATRRFPPPAPQPAARRPRWRRFTIRCVLYFMLQLLSMRWRSMLVFLVGVCRLMTTGWLRHKRRADSHAGTSSNQFICFVSNVCLFVLCVCVRLLVCCSLTPPQQCASRAARSDRCASVTRRRGSGCS